MHTQKRFQLLVALACAVCVGLSFLFFAERQKQAAEALRKEALATYGGEVVSVVVALKPLRAGQTIGATDIGKKEWIAQLLPKGVITKSEDVIGKKLATGVAAGLPLSQFNFKDGAAQEKIPDGMVGISVPLSEKLGVNQAPKVTVPVVAFAVEEHAVRRLSFQVKLVASPTQDALTQQKTVTLAVAPEDVEKILEALARSTLRLVVPGKGVKPESISAAAATSSENVDRENPDGKSQQEDAKAEDAASTVTSDRQNQAGKPEAEDD